MFVIGECKDLKEYDLFLEEYARGQKKDVLYPRCRGEYVIPYHQVPERIRETINRKDISSSTVRWQYDLDRNNQLTGEIEFVFEKGSEWFSIEGNLEDWQVFQNS